MATRAPKRYVQSFANGLSQLLSNSIGAYGPTLAITHFLPIYIPSLHNEDFGKGFTDLFKYDTDIGRTGIKGEPIWLPNENVRYEYKATNFSNIEALVNVSNSPVSGAVSSTDISACWENTILKDGNYYTLSKVSGGILGTSGWYYQTESEFYNYGTSLKMENLFPIKDYEAPLGSDNTVCGRYIVGFKDIGAKLGLTATDTKLQNIVNSKFMYNAVILYGFKVLSVGPTTDGQVQYGFSTEAIPVAIAGIEGQPITLNMNKMDSQGNEWDSVWNIDIDFVPFSVDKQINSITHRIVSEWSYWTKNQVDCLHTNNKIHVGMTVEPYGNSDQTNNTAAWVHISNKVIDPENFNVGGDEDYTRVAMDRRHLRMDADKTLVTLEMKDVGDSKGVLDINYYGVDTNQSGSNPSLDSTNPLLQAKGGSAFGSNDVAVGSGVTHNNTENSISFGKNVDIDGAGHKNTFTIGENITLGDNLLKTPNKNVISVGDGFRNRGSNLVKVGESSVHSDVAGDERNVVIVGDNQDSYIGLRSSLLIGSNNDLSAKFGDASYTDGKSLLVMGEGNQISTGDSLGSTVTSATSGVFSWSVKLSNGAISAMSGVSGLYNLVEGSTPTVVDKAELIGDRNRIHGQGANLVNWKVKGDNNNVYLSGGTSDLFEVVGNENTLNANQVTRIKVCGFRNDLNSVTSCVNIDGNNNSVKGSNIIINGDDNTFYGYGNHIRIFGDGNTVGRYLPLNVSFATGLERYGKNMFGSLESSDIGSGYDSAMFGSSFNVKENIATLFVGTSLSVNTVNATMGSLTYSKFDNVANSILSGYKIYSYGASSFEGKVFLNNSVVTGNKISISNSASSKYYGNLKYAGTNIIAVGDTFDLKNVENGLYVGSNIRSYGKQGFAMGRNIFLHTVADNPRGHIGAIGTNITFGLSSKNRGDVGDAADKLGSTTTVVIGDNISSTSLNSYYNLIQKDTLSFVSMPSLVIGNNAYGCNTFASSWGSAMLRVGKWAQNFTNDYGTFDGVKGWKFPHASLDSLSNATQFKANLPVLSHSRVFGDSSMYTNGTGNAGGRYYMYNGNGMKEMEDTMFVDEFGFVRMATSLNTNGRRECMNIYDTIIQNFVNNNGVLTYYSSHSSALNLIIDFLTDNTSAVDHVHKDYSQTYSSVASALSGANGTFKNLITMLNGYINTYYYRDGLATSSTHTSYIHVFVDQAVFQYPNYVDGVSGSQTYKVGSTIRAIFYYLNHSVVDVGTKHIHAPCIIEKLA